MNACVYICYVRRSGRGLSNVVVSLGAWPSMRRLLGPRLMMVGVRGSLV
jgi:hypothetical protein